MSDAGHVLYQAAWIFYAFGPQLVICLALGYGTARRSKGSLLTWLVIGFLAAVVPLAGVVVMAVLYWRARSHPRPAGAEPAAAATTEPAMAQPDPVGAEPETAATEPGAPWREPDAATAEPEPRAARPDPTSA
jgi:hypothetical protein